MLTCWGNIFIIHLLGFGIPTIGVKMGRKHNASLNALYNAIWNIIASYNGICYGYHHLQAYDSCIVFVPFDALFIIQGHWTYAIFINTHSIHGVSTRENLVGCPGDRALHELNVAQSNDGLTAFYEDTVFCVKPEMNSCLQKRT